MTKSKQSKPQRKSKRQAPPPPPKPLHLRQSASELTRLGWALRKLGGLGGGLAGNITGDSNAGKQYGTSLGALLSRWLGSGDYTLDSNSIVSKFQSNGTIPAMHSTGQSIIVRHKEYLADVVSGPTANSFDVFNTFALNPGLYNTFPWLSEIAQQFQEYTIRGMVFEFVSTSADAIASSTNTALGSVMMFTNYRATAASPTNKVQLLSEYFSTDAKPSESFCHPIECNPKENPYNVQYVRTGPVPSGEDQKTYDLGVFGVATSGFQGTNIVCGELWVTYEVELRKPIIPTSNPGGTIDSNYFHYSNTTGVSTTHYFGTGTASVITVNGITITLTGTTITFPLGFFGNFMLIYSQSGASTAYTIPTVTGTTNATALLGFNSDTNGTPAVSSTNTNMTVCSAWQVTNPEVQAVLTFSAGTVIATSTYVDLYIIPMQTFLIV